MPTQLVMDHSGHSTHSFEAGDRLSVEAAEKRFTELTGKGFTAAAIRGNGQNEVIRKFDPTVEETLFIPRYQGG